uniref:Uncharacterized protein n=1 Tax=Qingyuan Delta tick virus 1 TaxID=2972096 RepID=A0A9E7V1S8_9VIRU|nr:MAG: hypothetical protein [Qingyuan Delta tick virus 1]
MFLLIPPLYTGVPDLAYNRVVVMPTTGYQYGRRLWRLQQSWVRIPPNWPVPYLTCAVQFCTLICPIFWILLMQSLNLRTLLTPALLPYSDVFLEFLGGCYFCS